MTKAEHIDRAVMLTARLARRLELAMRLQESCQRLLLEINAEVIKADEAQRSERRKVLQ